MSNWKRAFVEHINKQDRMDLVEVDGVDDLSWLLFDEHETVSLQPGILSSLHAFADDGVPMFIVAEAYALTQDFMLHLAGLLKRMGMSAGFPDVIIFGSTPANPLMPGAAIELKRRDGEESDVRPAQREWLADLRARGWAAKACFGARDAVEYLKQLGY
jgi:hypothetical protein